MNWTLSSTTRKYVSLGICFSVIFFSFLRNSHAQSAFEEYARQFEQDAKLTPPQWHAKLEKQFSKVDSVTLAPTEKIPSFPAQMRDLIDPHEGYVAKILAIRNAKYTADGTTFILTRDATGYSLLNEFAEAIKRGVSVRLMVDSAGSLDFTHSELKALLAVEPGFVRDANGNPTKERAVVDVRTFNSLWHWGFFIEKWVGRAATVLGLDKRGPFRRWRNRRAHNKDLLIDIQHPELATVVSGGRNWADGYHEIPEKQDDTWSDAEIIIKSNKENPSLANLNNTIGADFSYLFYHKGNKKLGRNKYSETDAEELGLMKQSAIELLTHVADLKDKFKAAVEPSYADQFYTAEFEFVSEIANIIRYDALVNPLNFHENKPDANSIIRNVQKIASEAEKSISIISPYGPLEPGEVFLLCQWLRNDPSRRLRILTNALLTTDKYGSQTIIDNIINKTFMENPNWPYIKKQVKLYQLGRRNDTRLGGKNLIGALHAKLVSVDGKISAVSSSNGDGRSRYFNSESGWIIHSPILADKIERYFDFLEASATKYQSSDWKKIYDDPSLRTARVESVIFHKCLSLLKLVNLY